MSTANVYDDGYDIFLTNDTLISYDCQYEDLNVLKNHDNFIHNAMHLVDDLVANAPQNYGYKNEAYTEGGGDPAYGIAQCRDINDDGHKNYSSCLSNAKINLGFCSGNTTHGVKGAIIIRDECLLMYSDQNFFGQTNFDLNSTYCFYNHWNDTEFSVYWTTQLLIVLTPLWNSTTMFNINSLMIANGTYVHAMVECRRDLTAAACDNCLARARDELLNHTCAGQAVRKMFFPSCSLKFQYWRSPNS